MIELETRVKIPFLWGKAVFRKTNWSQINLIVGPNGSGKTLLAQGLAKQFEDAGFSVRFVKSDRGDRKTQLAILKSNDKIRQKIETVLSSMFGKSIKFIEDIDGTLIPIVENKAWNVEYMLEDAECHGLREIILLLISLYQKSGDINSGTESGAGGGNFKNVATNSGTARECIFFDEPELHLHPQFQTFFMNEIRKEVQHSSRKIFFLISHSPFFIDLRTPEDLTGVICCHINKVPTSIEELNEEDDQLFRRFLPRFNTYHKQFFFSDNQIFVEGYTDQQMFTYLLPFIENEYSAAGTGIIDVGGKDELGVFCKVCSLLGTNGRIITDLDSLFSGKLRDVFCEDERVISWLEKQREKQNAFYESIFTAKELEQEITLEKLIRKLERMLVEVGKSVIELSPAEIKAELKKSQKNREKNSGQSSRHDAELLEIFLQKLALLQEKHENAEAVDTYKTVLLQGMNEIPELLEKLLPPKIAATIPLVRNLSALVLAAAEAARVYVLHKGCIEHYYTQNTILFMPVSAKDRLFRNELDFIQTAHKKTIRKKYAELIVLLEKACST
ncbi:MAG: AAA family ATPase [Treponema sp.]|nr:AAA family ATPase [Treponema sp.]